MAKRKKCEKSWKKVGFSQKWRCCLPVRAFRTRSLWPPGLCAHFIYTSLDERGCHAETREKKPEFRPLSVDLGHFLTSDVILIENFCRLASIWLIGLMKLFALGRIDSALVYKLRLAGRAEKFTEEAIIMLRILSSVGFAWRPPSHPRRWRPMLRVSLLDTGLFISAELILCGGGKYLLNVVLNEFGRYCFPLL